MVTYYRNEETIVCIRSTFHLNLCSVLVDYSDPIKASLSEYTRLSECSEMESHSLFHIAIFYFLIRDLRMSKYNLSNLMIGCFPLLNYIWGTSRLSELLAILSCHVWESSDEKLNLNVPKRKYHS